MSEEMIFLSQRTRNLTFTALFAAVIAVCAQITVPMPSGVSFTLQTFAVALAGYLLGAKYGTLTVLVYLLLGAVGAPVFSAFHGGFHILLGKTGGYLWGFLPMVFLCGLAARGRGKVLPYLWGVPGLLLCHLFGTLQNMLLAGGGFWALLMVYSVPYLLKDVLTVAAAALLAARLRPQLEKHGIMVSKKSVKEI